MVSSEKKKNIILWTIVVVLGILFILSFTKNASSDRRKTVKTALLNPKNVQKIDMIQLFDSNARLEIKNCGSFWSVTSGESDSFLPADKQRVEKLVVELAKTRDLYKVSDSISKKNDFGLTDGSEVHIRYFVGDSSTELIFGKNDFSKTSRYFMTGRNTVVYEIDDSLDMFLSLNFQNWTEPYLISQQLIGKIGRADIQSISIKINGENFSLKPENDVFLEYSGKILELRHGGMAVANDEQIFTGEIELELGNKSKIIMKIYALENENEYSIRTVYDDVLNGKKYETCAKISSWTFSKLVM